MTAASVDWRNLHALLRSTPKTIVDEVQRDPALILAIKEIVDENAYAGQRHAGQFILCLDDLSTQVRVATWAD